MQRNDWLVSSPRVGQTIVGKHCPPDPRASDAKEGNLPVADLLTDARSSAHSNLISRRPSNKFIFVLLVYLIIDQLVEKEGDAHYRPYARFASHSRRYPHVPRSITFESIGTVLNDAGGATSINRQRAATGIAFAKCLVCYSRVLYAPTFEYSPSVSVQRAIVHRGQDMDSWGGSFPDLCENLFGRPDTHPSTHSMPLRPIDQNGINADLLRILLTIRIRPH
ncbi:hypothetical protein CFIO01_03201 [Colletotrichum fioriniae PJ7]|uniref:Uncharacterized protein n=1 Tax=Colletotrichum fioriniae PJ7 TaxID=1445577 RepID=A0A010QQ80_9PEZI|nr:hypothetical protein CFIO01_03201 [Colletotrichum fioriniae PJ7]